MKKKQKQKVFFLIFFLVGLLLFLSSPGFFSVISNSFDSVEVSLIETQEGAIINLEGNVEGLVGEGVKWSKTTTKTDSFNSKPSDNVYPKIQGINGEFPLVTTPQQSGDIFLSYSVWVQTPPSGSWAKSSGTTREGISTCRVINKGKVGTTDFYYVDLKCDLKVNYTCQDGSNCDLRGYTGGSVKNVFIPKVGFERSKIYRLENNECIFYDIYEKNRLTSDYSTLEDCESDIMIKTTFYRLENQVCNEIEIFPSEKTDKDYITLSECELAIEEEQKIKKGKLTELILGGIALLVLIISLIVWLVKRK